MDFVVMPASETMLPQIERIEQACFSVPWTRAQLASQLDESRYVFLAAVRGGEVLGYVNMLYVLDEGYIGNVAVAPDSRRMGVGRALIEAPEGGFVRLIEADTVAYDEVMKRVNNPISYELEKAGMTVRRLADLLGAPYRTVEDWNAGRRTPPKWLRNLVIEKIRAAAGSTGDLREP